MNSIIINIRHIIKTENAIIRISARKVLDIIKSYREKDVEKIILDFHGVTKLTSAFCSTIFTALYLELGEDVGNWLFVENVTEEHQFIIKESISLGLNPEKVQLINSLISELFE